MDSNRDDAEMCVKIGRAAMESGDRNRALKFVLKAQRLYPSPQADALLSELKKADEPRESGTNSAVSEEESCRFRVRDRNPRDGFDEREATPITEATADQIGIVRRINKTKDLYEILGLPKGCSVEDVRKAYRRISLRVHPDKNKAVGAEEAFKAVSKAFQCLSDADLRQKYDLYGPEDLQGLSQQQGMRRRQNEDVFSEEMFDPNEIFHAFFSGMQGGNGIFRKTNFAFRRGYGEGEGGGGTTQAHSINILGLVQLLSILALFLFSNFPFSKPIYSLEKVPPYEYKKSSKDHGVAYYVRSSSYDHDYPKGSQSRWNVEAQVERDYKEILSDNCRVELNMRRWGQITETPNCNKFKKFQLSY